MGTIPVRRSSNRHRHSLNFILDLAVGFRVALRIVRLIGRLKPNCFCLPLALVRVNYG